MKIKNLLNETPIDMTGDPNDPTVYGHEKANPMSLKGRIMSARAQLKELAELAESDELVVWEKITRLSKGGMFMGLEQNLEQVRHGIEELAAKRKKGGVQSRGIDRNIGEQGEKELDTIRDKHDNYNEDVDESELARIRQLSGLINEQVEQQFDLIEEMVEAWAESHGVDAEQIWEDFESVDDQELLDEAAAWKTSKGKSKKGGLNAKGVASYRRENPGSKLQMAVTTKPSKLKKGSKAAKRRKSFCARMGGVKGPMKKPNGKPTRKALALRKWNC